MLMPQIVKTIDVKNKMVRIISPVLKVNFLLRSNLLFVIMDA